MKSLLKLLALLALFAFPSGAEAACSGGTCFWVGGTGTLDLATDSAHWSITTGGATCSCEPATTDGITFDALSGGGTVTVNTTVTTANLTTSAFTGTLDFSANNNSITISGGFTDNGSGTHTINMGNGIWTLSSTSALFFVNNSNLTLNKNSSTLAFTAATAVAQRRLLGGGKSYNIVTVSGTTSQPFVISGANTIATLTVSAPNRLLFGAGVTNTITTFTSIAGSSSNQVLLMTADFASGSATISSANNWDCAWCGIGGMTLSGGGTFTGTNSFNLGQNSGITITVPATGGGGGRIIGG